MSQIRPSFVIGVGGTGYWIISLLKRKLYIDYGLKANETNEIKFLLLDVTSKDIYDKFKNETDDSTFKEFHAGRSECMHITVPQKEFFNWPDDMGNYDIQKNHWSRRNVFTQDVWANSSLKLRGEAEPFRLFGRTALDISIKKIATALDEKLTMINRHARTEAIPIYIFGSFAGGTGAGMMMDTAILIKSFQNSHYQCNHLIWQKTLSGFQAEIKEIAIQAFDNQDVQFDSLVNKLNLYRNASRNVLFDVCLVVQNFRRDAVRLPSLTFTPYDYVDKVSQIISQKVLLEVLYRLKYECEILDGFLCLVSNNIIEDKKRDLKKRQNYSCANTHFPGESLLNRTDPDSSAYIIYTSGSTGWSKGELIRHYSAVNLLVNLQRRYPLQEQDAYLLKTSYTLDVSVSEFFVWFMQGRRLGLLIPGGEKEPAKMVAITHLNPVPSMFRVFLDDMGPKSLGQLASLRYIFLAGEALPAAMAVKARSLLPGIVQENFYGPTEAAVYADGYSLSQWRDGPVFIDNPPANFLQPYVPDRYGKMQPVGVSGELCVGGDGPAVGYLNNPQLTSETFVDTVFYHGGHGGHGEEKPAVRRLYKTGDLAKWMPDGKLEFLGRIDNKVNVRGFRIELGEIQSQLSVHESIKEAVVIARLDQGGGKTLCAYVIGVDEWLFQTAPSPWPEIREYLSVMLPDYMIPSYFIPLRETPMTTSEFEGEGDYSMREETKVKRSSVFVSTTQSEKTCMDWNWQMLSFYFLWIFNSYTCKYEQNANLTKKIFVIGLFTILFKRVLR